MTQIREIKNVTKILGQIKTEPETYILCSNKAMGEGNDIQSGFKKRRLKLFYGTCHIKRMQQF